MKQHVLPLACILLLCIAIFISNFSAGVYLTGGDNLHPEFNFALNIKRAFFAPWQEYQGVGLVGGMGHATALVYEVFLWILARSIPTVSVRFVFTLFMILVGAVGGYFCIYLLLGKKVPAVVGSFFYVLNLATLQSFYTPFEVFTIHFATLPYELLCTILFLYKPSKKNALLLSLVFFLSTPVAYVPTIFLVILLTISIILLIFLREQPSFLSIKKITFVYGSLFCTNAFWLLPFLYFVFTNSSVAVMAKINQMATPQIFQQNKEAGHLLNAMLLQGFWFNNVTSVNNQQAYLMPIWRNYFSYPLIWLLGILFFVIICIGAFLAKEYMPIKPFFWLFCICFILLTPATFPFSLATSLLQHIPLFAEVFRFPFTKFSILAGFVYSVLFAIAFSYGTHQLKQGLFSIFFAVGTLTLLCVYMFPVFQGNLFFAKEKIAIPKDYVALFNYFKAQPKNTRIADFPQVSFWGWNFYSWGYQGSGFLWYGIQQPILDQTFDPWSSQNENYYWEISYALEQNNPSLFASVLNKYQVNYLLLDKNIVDPQNPGLYIKTNPEKFFASLPFISLQKKFGNILVYKVHLKITPKNFVFLQNNVPSVNGYKWNNNDTAFQQFANYQVLQSPIYVFPFRSLFSNKQVSEQEYAVRQTNDTISFTFSLPQLLHKTLILPSTNLVESFLHPTISITSPNKKPLLLTHLNAVKQAIFFTTIPKNSILTISFKKSVNTYTTDTVKDFSRSSIANCDMFRKGSFSASGNPFVVSSTGATACFGENDSFLPHNLGYITFVTAKYITGLPFHFWVLDPLTNQTPLNTNLPLGDTNQTYPFILAPLQDFSSGYSFHFDNISIADTSTNQLQSMRVFPIPYRLLTTLYFVTEPQLPSSSSFVPQAVQHPNASLYIVPINPTNQNTPLLVLSQGFANGWQAFSFSNPSFLTSLLPFLGGTKLPHVQVNNWENAWVLPLSTIQTTIFIVFWPQYLEYAGLALLVLFSLILCLKRKK